MNIPDFTTVEEFSVWYITSGMPLKIPHNSEVFVSDDATASCLFRHGRYQFEIYMIHAKPVIPLHEHPGVENVELSVPMLGPDKFELANAEKVVQRNNMSHGNEFRHRATHNGFVLYSAQKWEEGLEMSTIGARWKGHTAGPKHEALIKRFNPDCLVYPGYADVTLKNTASSVL
jgi:hypothetical protein